MRLVLPSVIAVVMVAIGGRALAQSVSPITKTVTLSNNYDPVLSPPLTIDGTWTGSDTTTDVIANTYAWIQHDDLTALTTGQFGATYAVHNWGLQLAPPFGSNPPLSGGGEGNKAAALSLLQDEGPTDETAGGNGQSTYIATRDIAQVGWNHGGTMLNPVGDVFGGNQFARLACPVDTIVNGGGGGGDAPAYLVTAQPNGLVNGTQVMFSGLLPPFDVLNGMSTNLYAKVVPSGSKILLYSNSGLTTPVTISGNYNNPAGPKPVITRLPGTFANCATGFQAITGDEIDVEVDNQTSVSRRSGLQIVLKPESGHGPVSPGGGVAPTDEAISISAATGTPDSWTHGLTFGSNSANWPFQNTSILVWAAEQGSQPMPALNFADLSAVTFSGPIEKFPNYAFWTLGVTRVMSTTARLTSDRAAASTTNTLNIPSGTLLSGLDQCTLEGVRTSGTGVVAAAWTSTFGFQQGTTGGITVVGSPAWAISGGFASPSGVAPQPASADGTNNGINISAQVTPGSGTWDFAATCFQHYAL